MSLTALCEQTVFNKISLWCIAASDAILLEKKCTVYASKDESILHHVVDGHVLVLECIPQSGVYWRLKTSDVGDLLLLDR